MDYTVHAKEDILISYGANSFDSGLDQACQGGHLNIVKFMLEKGAKLTSLGLQYTYLGHDKEEERIEIIKLFISNGVKIPDDFIEDCSNLNIIKFLAEHVKIKKKYILDNTIYIIHKIEEIQPKTVKYI